MSRAVPAARIRATDLYDLAVCPHRIALDRRLPRDARTPPGAATAQLLEHGLALEAEVAAALGYPQPEYAPGDFVEGARRTRALLEAGVPGVFQAVLFDGRQLAIPDLLRRVEGASALGPFHYEPGDVKAGLAPRADHVLQVAYGGRLLAALQGLPPSHGFLVLGDRREERFPLGELQHVLTSAVAQVEAIVEGGGGAEGDGETFPFLGPGCAGCRWRGTCIPQLVAGDDLSLVDGMTRTRHRVLRRHGVATVHALAALDPAAWRAAGRPPLGLDLLTRQAAALADGRVSAGPHARPAGAARGRAPGPPRVRPAGRRRSRAGGLGGVRRAGCVRPGNGARAADGRGTGGGGGRTGGAPRARAAARAALRRRSCARVRCAG